MGWRRREDAVHEGVAVRGQAGIALVPALMAIVVINLTILSLFGLLLTVLLSANAHRRTVLSGIEATTVFEAVRHLDYVGCEGAANMESRLLDGPTPVYVPPAGYTAEITQVRFISDGASAAPTFVSSCTTDQGVQEVTVRVTNAKHPDVSEEIVALKRDDTCPAAVLVALPGERC